MSKNQEINEHSPAPWEATGGSECYLYDGEGNEIGRLFHTKPRAKSRRDANKRIVLASVEAIETLEALLADMAGARGLQSPCVPSQKVIARAQAVVNQARGRQ